MSLHTPEQTALQSRGYPVIGDAQTLAEWPLVTDITQDHVYSPGGRKNWVDPKSTFDSKIQFLKHTVQSKGLNSQYIRNTREDRSSQGWLGKKLSQAVPNVPKPIARKRKIKVTQELFHTKDATESALGWWFPPPPNKLIPFLWIDRPFLLLYRHDL